MTDASAVTTSSTATTTIGAKAVPGREPLLAVNDLRVEFAARRVVHAVRGLSYTIAPLRCSACSRSAWGASRPEAFASKAVSW